MKIVLLHFLIILALMSPAVGAFALKPGDRFPDLQLASINGGGESSVSSLTDRKLMLHLFASW